MTEKMRSAENLDSDERFERVIVYSDLLRAARAGWRWSVGFALFAILVSVIWDVRRPPIYEAKAAIRVGWVHDGGVSTVPIEPIDDLVIMIKQERFLKDFFAAKGIEGQDEKNEFVESLSIIRPSTNVVEFRNKSKSPESARVWLERLIFLKVAEHEKIVSDFVAPRQQFVAECFRAMGGENPKGSADVSSNCLPQQLVLGYQLPPLMVPTVVSQPVNVEESRVFPSLHFLIVVSVVGSFVFGTIISVILGNYKILNKPQTV